MDKILEFRDWMIIGTANGDLSATLWSLGLMSAAFGVLILFDWIRLRH